MIIPIRAYGDPVLRKKCKEIDEKYQDLDKLIQDMFETMEASNGIGLAAPQIGLPIRLFIVDTAPLADDKEFKTISKQLLNFKKVFINAKIINEFGKEWKFNEGCLSIPEIRENITRKETIEIEYYDENWEYHKENISDIRARVIQHEYDHIEGILFTDLISPLKKKLIQKKLNSISKGDIKTEYKIKFYK